MAVRLAKVAGKLPEKNNKKIEKHDNKLATKFTNSLCRKPTTFFQFNIFSEKLFSLQ
jgi:hypothetical protein